MRFSAPVLTSLAAVAAFATIAIPASADMTQRVYALSAQNGSGEVGTMTLTAMGDKTRVDLALANSPTDTPQPAHIHDGPCAKLNPKPKLALANVVNGLSSTVVAMPLAQLMSGTYAINVHKSTSDIPAYVSCGDIGAK